MEIASCDYSNVDELSQRMVVLRKGLEREFDMKVIEIDEEG